MIMEAGCEEGSNWRKNKGGTRANTRTKKSIKVLSGVFALFAAQTLYILRLSTQQSILLLDYNIKLPLSRVIHCCNKCNNRNAM
jgi:hypothetical protein